MRGGDFKWRFVRSVHEKEVYFPEAVFPFAEARHQAILALKSPEEIAPTLPDVPLPFAFEAGEAPPKDEAPVKVPEIIPRVHITMKRVYDYGPTPGCEACIMNAGAYPLVGGYKKHTDECKKRFLALLDQETGTSRMHVKPTNELASGEPSEDPHHSARTSPIFGRYSVGGSSGSGIPGLVDGKESRSESVSAPVEAQGESVRTPLESHGVTGESVRIPLESHGESVKHSP